MKPVTPEKFLGLVFRAVGQQRDAEEIFLARELDRMVEQFRTIPVSLVFLMDHQIFQHDHEAAFGRADGEKQIYHPDDRAIAAEDENATPARLFENQS